MSLKSPNKLYCPTRSCVTATYIHIGINRNYGPILFNKLTFVDYVFQNKMLFIKTFYVYSSFGTVRLFIGHLFWCRRTTCQSSQRKGKGLGKKYWKKYLIFNQICKDNWGKLTQLHLCAGRFMHGHLFVFTMFQTCPNYHQDANYRPPTKLREGNIFSHVCLSVILFTGMSLLYWIPACHPLYRVLAHLDLIQFV